MTTTTATSADDEARPPIGLRQNNPGNIRLTKKDKWQESLPPQPGDQFVRFRAPQWGIRAIAKILISYDKAGISTPYDFAKRWAPPGDNNDTTAYAKHIADALAVELYDYIDLDSFEVALPLVKAVILHENGRNPYKDQIIIDGLRMGGIKDAPQKSLAKKGSFLALSGTGVTGTLLAANEAVAPVKKVVDGLDPFSAAPPVQWLVTAGLTLCAGLGIVGAIGLYFQHRKGLG
jgi:hypothetical protein